MTTIDALRKQFEYILTDNPYKSDLQKVYDLTLVLRGIASSVYGYESKEHSEFKILTRLIFIAKHGEA